MRDEAKSREALTLELDQLRARIDKLEWEKAENDRTRLALQEEIVRRRTLMDQSRDGIVVLNQDGKVHEANRAFAEMLGYSREEVSQLYVWDWDAQMTRQELDEAVRLIDASGDHFTTRHRRKDGSIYDVEITSTAAVWRNQKLISCVCRDITDRLRSEETLRESEEKYRAIVEQSAEGIVLIEPETLRFVDFNDAACDGLGYSRQEFAALTLFDIQAAMTREEVGKRAEALLKSGHAYFENRQRGKDGTVRDVVISNRVINLHGSQYFAAIWQDVTYIKQAENALR
jgi:PAS domain S-box-containing protein